MLLSFGQVDASSLKLGWSQEKMMHEMVVNAWDDAAGAPNFVARTTLVHVELHRWDKEFLNAPKKRLEDVKVRAPLIHRIFT